MLAKVICCILPNMGQANHGIIVGVDQEQEWLLPWWYERYSRWNCHPVFFVDFGMSQEALQFCKARGECAALPPRNFPAPATEEEKQAWQQMKKKWNPQKPAHWRKATCLKPSALRLSPFDVSIWMDLDCEITASLEPLFVLPKEMHFGVGKDRAGGYNSGVVVFRKESPLLGRWEAHCQSRFFPGDDWALTDLVRKEKWDVAFLPPEWNWMMVWGANPYAKVYHWCSGWGKEYIRRYGGIESLR